MGNTLQTTYSKGTCDEASYIRLSLIKWSRKLHDTRSTGDKEIIYCYYSVNFKRYEVMKWNEASYDAIRTCMSQGNR